MADSVVQDIKDKLDIAEVVGSYIQLKRVGVNWRANCPFHSEKTPSFNVNSSRQIWHCFGCGLGGDVFSFVQQYEHLEFFETLQQLADRAGVTLPERSSGQRVADAKQKEIRERVFRVNTFAAKFYHQILLSDRGQEALRYLIARGLTPETIAQWEIGYAPGDFQALEKQLLAKGANKDDMVTAGVSARSARGTYDRFRGRVTFPILDFGGRAVGFSARLLPNTSKEETAKYINSPESPVYTKGRVLFGLFQAKNAIREQDYVVVMEGQMDCIKTHQAGFKNTVATSGTALTSEQLRLLARLTKNIKLCFDADAAGEKAAKKAGMLAMSLGFSVKMITLAGAKDADELISQNPKLWEDALKDSVWFIEYYLRQAESGYAPRSVEQRKFITAEVVPLLALLTDPLERDTYAQQLTERFGFGRPALTELMNQNSKPPTLNTFDQQAPSTIIQQSPDLPQILPIEKEILGIFLFVPSMLKEWTAVGGQTVDFTSTAARSFMEQLLAGETVQLESETLAQEALFMVESGKAVFDGTEAAYENELRKAVYTFRLTALKNQQEHITAHIRVAEANTQTADLQDLQREFARLAISRLDLERKIQSF